MPKGKPINLVGHKYGKWTVFAKATEIYGTGSSMWWCKCQCGKVQKLPIGNLRAGLSKQCRACAGKQKRNPYKRHPLYKLWYIRIEPDCIKPWLDFETWLEDVEPRTGKNALKLNVSKPYGPSNFEWADCTTKLGDRIQIGLLRLTKQQWADKLGLSKQRVYQLIHKFGSLENALRLRADHMGLDLDQLTKQGNGAMAEKLTGDAFNGWHSEGRPEKYPWSEWTDGAVWKIRQGEDFDIELEHMQRSLHIHANNNGLKVKTRKDFTDLTALIFQFTKPGTESTE